MQSKQEFIELTHIVEAVLLLLGTFREWGK